VKLSTKDFMRALTPNEKIGSSAMLIIGGFWIAAMLAIWSYGPSALIPRPIPVLKAFGEMLMNGDLLTALWSSLVTNLEAIAIATVITLVVSYGAVLGIMRPVSLAATKGRFLGLSGLTFLFTVLLGGGHTLKVALITFGIAVFFISSMVAIIDEIPKDEFDHARSLGMSEWRVTFEVVVLGRADQVLEQMRLNAAIGWVMLTMVEGFVRSEGGLGALLINDNKHFLLENVFAIQLAIAMFGLGMDYAFRMLKDIACPYANMTLERK